MSPTNKNKVCCKMLPHERELLTKRNLVFDLLLVAGLFEQQQKPYILNYAIINNPTLQKLM